MAKFPTDVAAKYPRASLSCAVDHVPDALLNMSTTLEGEDPAVTPSDSNLLHRKHNKQQAPRLKHANVTPSPTRISPNKQPLNKQRETIVYVTSREDGHVPNRCRSKTLARHTELRSRPCARCTVVQIHNIGISTTCSDPHETTTSYTAKHNKQQAPRLKHANVTPSPTRIKQNSSPSTNNVKTAIF
jgi:hypothetical protein